MNLSISSVLTYCTLISVLTAVICWILNRDKVICRIGPKWASVIAVLLIARMFLPFEFEFTYSVYVDKLLPKIHDFFRYEVVLGAFSIAVWRILVFVWVIGIVYHLVKKLRIYKKMMQIVMIAPKEELNVFLTRNGLEEFCGQEGKMVQVVTLQGLQVPCIIGFRNKYILMTENAYTREELKLIIQHEMMHCQRNDLLWKALIDFLCSVFWWNPAFTYLKETVFRMVEIEDDFDITASMSEDEKTEYMSCLMKMAVQQKKEEIPFAVPFGSGTMKELKQRMYVLDAGIKNERWLGRGVIIAVIGCLFLVSFVIFEPYTLPPGDENYETVPFDYENSFIIKQGDDYDVYENGEYVFTTDEETVKNIRSLKIYNSMEERLHDE